MNDQHVRTRIRLTSQAEVLDFICALCRYEDSFSIESCSGRRIVNAKSFIGVIYTMVDSPDDMYLVNMTRDGVIPASVDRYRVAMV